MLALRARYTIVLVTHSMQEAVRVSDDVAFFYSGTIVESGATQQLFARPRERRTAEYIAGRFG
jgi:phosphate transport system ATP-binding protein